MTLEDLRNASTLLRFSSPTSSLTTLFTMAKTVRQPSPWARQGRLQALRGLT